MTRVQCFCLLAILSGVAGLAFLAAIIHTWINPKPYDPQFGVVLDAGSTHTSVHLYTWEEEDRVRGTAREVSELGDHCKTEKGIGQFVNPHDAAESLRPCLDDLTREIPRDAQTRTSVFFAATAGMRILRQQNPELAEKILKAAESILATYPLDVKTTQILSGAEEGAAGWTSVNFLTKNLPKGQPKKQAKNWITYGSLDTGGASSQIVFQTPNAGEYEKTLDLYGREYDVYAQSFLCYGTAQAENMLLGLLAKAENYTEYQIESPCYAQGYATYLNGSEIFQVPCFNSWWTPNDWKMLYPMLKTKTFSFKGTGDPSKCQKFIKQLFPPGACASSRCSFNGTDLPDYGYTKFIASSGSYYFTAKALNFLDERISLDEFKSRIEAICLVSFDDIKKKSPESDWYYAVRNCYTTMYMYTLLTDAYKFDEHTWKNIEITKKINGTSIGWSLGLLLNETGAMPPVPAERPSVYLSAWVVMIVLASTFTIITIVLLYLAYKASIESRAHDLMRP